MKNLFFTAIVCGAIAALFFTACDKNSDTQAAVILQFDHVVGTKALELNKIQYNALAGHLYSVERLKYYVSRIVLHRADGSAFQTSAVHYREEGADETASLTLPDVPEGEYTHLSFIVGLDEATNQPNKLPQTVQNINMEWPIPGQEGYHYMKFEGKYDSMGSGIVKSFNLHTGAVNNQPYYVAVDLPLAGLSVSGDTWQIRLKMDLNEWLQDPHTYDFEQFGPGIMAKPDAQQMLMENGASLFSVGSIERK